MLKIKDDVDLKELEKFGLVPNVWVIGGAYIKEENDVEKQINYVPYQVVVYKDRQIRIYNQSGNEILFDLIQAGLVEKVADNK